VTFVDILIKLFRHNTDDPVYASLITRPTRQIAETENLDSNMNWSDWTKVGERVKYSRSKKHFEAAIDFSSKKRPRIEYRSRENGGVVER
jgi:hypothetical protein